MTHYFSNLLFGNHYSSRWFNLSPLLSMKRALLAEKFNQRERIIKQIEGSYQSMRKAECRPVRRGKSCNFGCVTVRGR
jgi:hypothetical protein